MGRPIYKVVGDEIINEMMLAGFTVIFLTIGINYFNLKYAWANIINTIAQSSGMDVILVASEISLMLETIENTFPFNFLFGSQQSIIFGLVIGVFLTIIGFYLKIVTTPTREELIKEVGREFYIPAIIGLFAILAMQVVTAIFVQGHFASTPSGINPDSIFISGILIWNTYGKLLVIGLSSLVIGSVILVVSNSRRNDIGRLVGRTMVYGSYLCIGWYGVIRILALDTFLTSEYGPFFKTFILSGDAALGFLIFCIFSFTFGLAMSRYGSVLVRRKIMHMKKVLKEKAIQEGRYPVVGARHLRKKKTRR